MRRVPELDAIRGLAALAIMINHLPFTSRFFRAGAYGVDLFFVLSGYLITTIILDHGRSRGFMASFYARRSLRIWPIYYLALLGVALVNPFLPRPYPMDGLLNYLTYTQNIQEYWFGAVPPFNPCLDHTWTLAIEEQYYLFWPALVCLLGPRSVVPLGLLLTGVAFGARSVGFSNRILLGRCEGFALGGLLAALAREAGRSASGRRALVAVLSAAALAALGYPAWSRALPKLATPEATARVAESARLAAATLGFFALTGAIVVLAGRPVLAPLRDRRLCYLGQISYGIYLYHYIVYCSLDGWLGAEKSGRWWMIGLKMGASLALAALSWELLERPILALKERFGYDRAARAIAPATAAAAAGEAG